MASATCREVSGLAYCLWHIVLCLFSYMRSGTANSAAQWQQTLCLACHKQGCNVRVSDIRRQGALLATSYLTVPENRQTLIENR
jgi:hypothetical protein